MYKLAHSSWLICFNCNPQVHGRWKDAYKTEREKTILVSSPDPNIINVTLLRLSDSRLHEMQFQLCCIFDTPLYVSFVSRDRT